MPSPSPSPPPAPGPSRLRAVPAERDLAGQLKEHSDTFRKVKEIERGNPDPRGGDAVPVDLSHQHCSTVRSPIPAMLAESMSLADEPEELVATDGAGAPDDHHHTQLPHPRSR
jgi:hypothetical protein